VLNGLDVSLLGFKIGPMIASFHTSGKVTDCKLLFRSEVQNFWAFVCSFCEKIAGIWSCSGAVFFAHCWNVGCTSFSVIRSLLEVKWGFLRMRHVVGNWSRNYHPKKCGLEVVANISAISEGV